MSSLETRLLKSFDHFLIGLSGFLLLRYSSLYSLASVLAVNTANSFHTMGNTDTGSENSISVISVISVDISYFLCKHMVPFGLNT